MAPATAWLASGAGTMPSVAANNEPAWKHSNWGIASASSSPSSFKWEISGAIAWYRKPPECVGGGMNVCPRVCDFTNGVFCAVSPKSYAYFPFVSDGQLAGSTATTRIAFLASPRSFAPMYGKHKPPKFDPPPVHPTSTSGYSPAISICFMASMPVTVWCSRTWFSTLPRAYLLSSTVAARSQASEMAIPSDPGQSGSFSRICLPTSVSWDGDA
mmetsp:Transcript_60523/g.162359  ORF Transcript_60523/g.162359 Transcript_60523/m.162359 type:complete len:214 (-) Transcript_60523:1148-1789(-)